MKSKLIVILLTALIMAGCGGNAVIPPDNNPDYTNLPADITPNWLNYDSRAVAVNGNYAYMASGVSGLLIFNITDPLNPVLVKRVDTPVYAWDVAYSSGYVYLAEDMGLAVINVDPPESASLVKIIEKNHLYSPEIIIRDNYIFFSNMGDVDVYRIDSPGSISLVTDDFLGAYAFCIDGDYAYCASMEETQVFSVRQSQWPPNYETHYYFEIYDINPIESTHLVRSIEIDDLPVKVIAENGYAWLVGGDLTLIDVDPPESMFVVSVFATPGDAYDFRIIGNYAYVSDDPYFVIFDISDPTNPQIEKIVDVSCPQANISIINGSSAYLTGEFGINYASFKSPALSYVTKLTHPVLNATSDVFIDNGYAFIADHDLKIIDIDPLKSTTPVVKTIDLPSDVNSVFVRHGYAYITYSRYISIIDVNPPDSAEIVKTIDAPFQAVDVFAADGFAYAALEEEGMMIIDIHSPESAFEVKTVDTPGKTLDVFVDGGYAYIAVDNAGLDIIDVDPPETAAIVGGVKTDGLARGVVVSGGYAYVADGNYGTKVIDISPVESAHLVINIETGVTHGVFLKDNILYVAGDMKGLILIDVSQPELPVILNTIDTPDHAMNVFACDDSAYVADLLGGLRIIKLR
jgi:hypothetical protein